MDIMQQWAQFIAGQKTLVLSTVDQEGQPFQSYAPFVKKEDAFYIYISRTAEHHDFLAAHPVAHMMILKDESASQNQFARERTHMRVNATMLGEAEHEHIFELFNEQHPPQLITMLRGLDFSLFKLTADTARYV
ncbi:MAG: pyridoxamine 5'-phosphate oxidase family protein, partial [Bacilli bacterium]